MGREKTYTRLEFEPSLPKWSSVLLNKLHVSGVSNHQSDHINVCLCGNVMGFTS